MTKNDIVLGIIFQGHDIKINQLELDLIIISLNKTLELKKIQLPMAKIVYLGTLNGLSKVLVRPKIIRIFERRTILPNII